VFVDECRVFGDFCSINQSVSTF